MVPGLLLTSIVTSRIARSDSLDFRKDQVSFRLPTKASRGKANLHQGAAGAGPAATAPVITK